ncbi:MAG: hypothetical protein LBB74_04390 [Chitinispirillales bacterium]|nr:hypothetical protein [Chitinispirillales bacterium]
MKTHPLIAALPMLALTLAAVAVPVSAQTQQFNSCVENEGADISVTLPGSFTTANANLPDPFTMLSGSRMTTKEQWKQRRQELLKLLEKTVYGTKPAKPASVTGTVSRTSISVSAGGGSFSVSVSMPSGGSAPYPLVIRYDNSGVPSSNYTGNGVAVANYTTNTVGGGTSRSNKTGAFYTANPNNKSTGHLAAWAWGVSRIIDVIEADPNKLFDPTKIAVTGCSRDGKGAFVAGVLDQRVALTMPMESGTGGMASMRVAYNNRDQGGGTNGSQSPSSAYGEQPWLGDDFSTFQNSPNNLPIDLHEAVALVAPRGFLAVYKTASSAGQWLNVPGSHVSAIAGVEVYKALGYGGNFGWMNTGTEAHCSWPSAYNSTVKDFIDIYLHRTKAPATAPVLTENSRPATAASMVNWTTPTLTGTLAVGCGSAPPAPTPSKFTLTVSPATLTPVVDGTVTYSPAKPSDGKYDSATVVKLTAVPAQGYAFDSWGGDATGTKDTVSVIMNANKNVTVKFKSSSTGIRNAAYSAKRFSGLTATTSGSALNITFNAKNSGATLLKLYSLKGDLISSASINTVAGNNYSHTFNATKMPTGYYLVSLYNDGRAVEQARVVIPR